MKNFIVYMVAGILVAIGLGYLFVPATKDNIDALGAFSDPFLSIQLAASPSNGNCLTTDGTNNAWGSCGAGVGGSGTVLYVQNGGATLNTSTTTLNFTSNSFTLVEDPADTFAIRVATTTLGLLTTNVSEGSNLYYTDTRARAAITETVLGLEFNTGVLGTSTGYFLPTTTRAALWDEAYSWGNHASAGYDQVTTAGDGLTRTVNDFDCDTASGTTFGCLSAANWTTFNGKQDTITAGDALTLTGTDIDFDGGASPSGDLGGTWASPSVTDDSHAHTGTTLSSIDISSDTNLSADGTEIILTGDALSLGTALTFTTGTSTTSFFSGLGTFTNSIINTLLTAAAATFTGLVDIGAGVLEIPNGTGPTVDSIGELAIDSTSNQLVLYGSEKKVIGNGNFYPAFTYATSTAWTGTTTIPLGTAYVAETWNGVQCFTDAGTIVTRFGDGTNWTNVNNSSTTVGTTVFTTNNTFTAGEKRYVEVGTPASSPTKISCTVSKSITSD